MTGEYWPRNGCGCAEESQEADTAADKILYILNLYFSHIGWKRLQPNKFEVG